MSGAFEVTTDTVQRTEEYRRRKETAVLAIAFCDIVDSTTLLESMGEHRYGGLLEGFRARVDEVVTRDDAGSVVQFLGDGALAVFSEPSTAVERCVELARSSAPFTLRVGLDLGQIAKQSIGGTVREVFGRHVYRAARVQSAAQPGEVLTTFQIYDCAVGWLRQIPISWHDRGLHVLKGFAEPVHLFAAMKNPDAAPADSAPAFRVHGERAAEAERSRRASAGDEVVFRGVAPGAYEMPTRFEPSALLQQQGLSSGPRDTPSIADFPLLRELALDLQMLLRQARIPRRFLDRFSPRRKSGRSLRLLWVDDFPENNRSLSASLHDLGFRIDTAMDTADALSSLQKRRYAAIISDMGRASSPTAGLNLLRALNESGDATPVIVYASTVSVAAHGDEAIALGAHAATSGAVTLLASLKAILSSPAG